MDQSNQGPGGAAGEARRGNQRLSDFFVLAVVAICLLLVAAELGTNVVAESRRAPGGAQAAVTAPAAVPAATATSRPATVTPDRAAPAEPVATQPAATLTPPVHDEG